MRPSSSKSAAANPLHQPLKESSDEDLPSENFTGAFHAFSCPRAFLKMRTGPHSQARSNSGQPSSSRSLHTAELTSPTSFSSAELTASTCRPSASFRKSHEGADSG